MVEALNSIKSYLERSYEKFQKITKEPTYKDVLSVTSISSIFSLLFVHYIGYIITFNINLISYSDAYSFSSVSFIFTFYVSVTLIVMRFMISAFKLEANTDFSISEPKTLIFLSVIFVTIFCAFYTTNGTFSVIFGIVSIQFLFLLVFVAKNLKKRYRYASTFLLIAIIVRIFTHPVKMVNYFFGGFDEFLKRFLVLSLFSASFIVGLSRAQTVVSLPQTTIRFGDVEMKGWIILRVSEGVVFLNNDDQISLITYDSGYFLDTNLMSGIHGQLQK